LLQTTAHLGCDAHHNNQHEDVQKQILQTLRTLQLLAGIKNQGMCGMLGSCWAFAAAAAAAAIESAYAIATNQLVELSPQQLLQCARPEDYFNEVSVKCNAVVVVCGRSSSSSSSDSSNSRRCSPCYSSSGQGQKTTSMPLNKH
jgi:hypothetical protein